MPLFLSVVAVFLVVIVRLRQAIAYVAALGVDGVEAAIKADETSALQGNHALIALGQHAVFSRRNLNLCAIAAAELEGDVVALASMMMAVAVIGAAVPSLGDNQRLGGNSGLSVVVRPSLEAFDGYKYDENENSKEDNRENHIHDGKHTKAKSERAHLHHLFGFTITHIRTVFHKNQIKNPADKAYFFVKRS